MKKLNFWKDWSSEFRLIYQAVLILLGLSTILYYTFYFLGINAVLAWEIQEEIIFVPINLDSFFEGIFPMEIPGSTLMLQNIFQVSPFRINLEASYILLFLWALLLSLIVSILTFLKRLWYVIGMGAVLFFLATLQLDFLQIMSNTDASFYVLLLLYLPLSYYFQAFNQKIPFISRFAIFLLITFGVGIWIFTASEITFPWIYITSYASILPIVLTLVFITMVSQDIPYIFVYLTTQAKGQKNTLINFLVIIALYLANLILLYLERTHYLEWGITYIEPFWFFPISILLGIWGYKKRSSFISKILPFEPYGALLYGALAILSLVTMTYYFLTANDSMIWVFDNFLLYSHLSFGFIFFFYILINFSPLFQQGLTVYKVAYEGDVFSYKMFRFVGFAVLFIFFMKNIELGFFFARAGYFNSLGDAAIVNQEEVLAEEYYLKAIENDYLNHHARYQFATLAESTSEIPAAILVLTEALQRNPNPFTYNRLSDLYWRNSSPKLSITILREAIEKYPDIFELHNNLAMRYANQNRLDSAQYFLEKAQSLAENEIILVNNQKTLVSNLSLEEKQVDSLFKQDLEPKNTQGLANWVALFNIYKKEYTTKLKPKPFTDTLLTDEEFVYLYNFSINQLQKPDTSLINLTRRLSQKEENATYRSNLQFLIASRLYYQGKSQQAFNIMTSLSNLDTDAYFNRVLGMWLIEQKAYIQAIPYLKKAVEFYDFLSVKYLAIALSEVGEKEDAILRWKQTTAIEEFEFKGFANQMLEILKDSSLLATDVERFLFVKYGKNYFDENRLFATWEETNELTYKVWAGSELMQFFLKKNKTEQARSIYEKLNKYELKRLAEYVESAFYIAYFELLLAEKNYQELLNSLRNTILVRPYQLKTPYFQAVALQGLGKYKEAKTYFVEAIEALPYDEEVILASANYVEKYEKDSQKSYEILAKAVQINQYSKELFKAYAIQAVRIGVGFYGDDVLPEIQKLANEAEYQAFLKEYEAEKQRQAEKLKNF